MFLAEFLPCSSRALLLPVVYICLPVAFILAILPQKAFTFATKLKRVVFLFLFFKLSLTLEANAKNTFCMPLWVILVAVLLSLLYPTSVPFQTTVCLLAEWTPPFLRPFVRDSFPLPSRSFLRVKSRLLFLLYKSLHDLALSSHQTNLSIPRHTKLVSSTWSVLSKSLHV